MSDTTTASTEAPKDLQVTISHDILALLKQLLVLPLQNIIANPSATTVAAQAPGLIGNAIAESPAAQGLLIKDTAQYILDHVNSLTPPAPTPIAPV